jgi:hypothetical protein
LKIHPQESYNFVVKRLATNAYDWEPLSEESIKQIEEGLRDYREGKLNTCVSMRYRDAQNLLM